MLDESMYITLLAPLCSCSFLGCAMYDSDLIELCIPIYSIAREVRRLAVLWVSHCTSRGAV
jgi:hypothetical protein